MARSPDSPLGPLFGRTARAASIPIVAAAALFLSACSHAIPLQPSLYDPPAAAPLPLAVGVFFSPEFRAYEHAESKWGDNWVFPLGRASTALLDGAFARAFETTLPVRDRPPLGPDGPDVAAVIEPRIEGFTFTLPFLKTGEYTATITYRFVIHSPAGEPAATWTVTGTGAAHGEVGFEFARWPGAAADLAMEDAAAKFVTGLRDTPEVRRWLRGINTVGRHEGPASAEPAATPE